jgi:molecular chaperone GrpE
MNEPHPQDSAQPTPESAGPGPAPASEPAIDPLQALRQEKDELYQRLLRVSADYQNYVRRSEAGRADDIDRARGDLFKLLLPVLDHFDTALSNEPASDDGKALSTGVKIVRDELLKVLAQQGVERLTAKVGEPFDPRLHEAMLRQPAPGVESNHVSSAFQPGYVFRGRTLRPAKVAVAP